MSGGKQQTEAPWTGTVMILKGLYDTLRLDFETFRQGMQQTLVLRSEQQTRAEIGIRDAHEKSDRVLEAMEAASLAVERIGSSVDLFEEWSVGMTAYLNEIKVRLDKLWRAEFHETPPLKWLSNPFMSNKPGDSEAAIELDVQPARTPVDDPTYVYPTPGPDGRVCTKPMLEADEEGIISGVEVHFSCGNFVTIPEYLTQFNDVRKSYEKFRCPWCGAPSGVVAVVCRRRGEWNESRE